MWRSSLSVSTSLSSTEKQILPRSRGLVTGVEEIGEEILPNTPGGWARAAIVHFNFSFLMQRVDQINFVKLVKDIESGKRQLPDLPEEWVEEDE